MNDSTLIHSLNDLTQHYPAPRPSSRSKVHSELSDQMQHWLQHSPFFILASVGENGIDCSPRGDLPEQAFRVIDNRTIAIPDRRGNNRIDTLRNILKDPSVGMVFLIPGVDEALRIKGRACISIDPELLKTFNLDGVPPATVILITITTAYVQNARAMRSADLWNSQNGQTNKQVPTAAQLSKSDSL